MKNKILIQLSLLVLLSLHSVYSYANNNIMYKKIDSEIQFLMPYIGSFPPTFKSENEKKEITKHYVEGKKYMDEQITKHPNDLQLLFRRGKLQSMGHNMDVSEAWQGSENDLLKVINLDPKHKGAYVELASLYVGSDPALASKAEKLYKTAEPLSGNEYNQDIQRGLFFAYYYQGKLCEAHVQAKLLVKNWPNANYNVLLETVDAVLSRNGTQCSG